MRQQPNSTRRLRILEMIIFTLLICLAIAPKTAAAKPKSFTILQFNDVYEIFPVPALVDHDVKPRGGMAYAGTLIRQARKEGPVLVLHAGDFISPSLLSIKFLHKGEQMVDAMNAIGVDFATFGNHEFDFGCKVLDARIRQSRFSWLSANVKLPDEMTFQRGKVKPYEIKKIAGLTVGIFGVSLPLEPVPCGEAPITFSDPFEASREMVKVLKRNRVDLIVALTHLRARDDRMLAEILPEIDFIVGGHDHEAMVEVVGKTLMTKAGTNAHNLGIIGVKAVQTGNEWVVEKSWKRKPVDPETISPDPEVVRALEKYTNELKDFDRVIGTSEVTLDVREVTVREKECSFGNYLTDVMRREMKTDIAFINSGAFRGDRIIPPGPLTLTDLYTVLLFENTLHSTDITGEELLRALENGVSMVGEKDGRFPHVSGMSFVFDPEKPPGQRVTRVFIGDKPIDPHQTYTMATIDFLLDRGSIDGYSLPKRNVKNGKELNPVILEDLKNAPLRSQVEGRIIEE